MAAPDGQVGRHQPVSFPIPHFRDKDDLSTEMRLALAEAALQNMRRYAGHPDGHKMIETTVVQPPVFVLPTLRDRDKAPIVPEFEPLWSPATCSGAPPGLIPTKDGLLKRD